MPTSVIDEDSLPLMSGQASRRKSMSTDMLLDVCACLSCWIVICGKLVCRRWNAVLSASQRILPLVIWPSDLRLFEVSTTCIEKSCSRRHECKPGECGHEENRKVLYLEFVEDAVRCLRANTEPNKLQKPTRVYAVSFSDREVNLFFDESTGTQCGRRLSTSDVTADEAVKCFETFFLPDEWAMQVDVDDFTKLFLQHEMVLNARHTSIWRSTHQNQKSPSGLFDAELLNFFFNAAGNPLRELLMDAVEPTAGFLGAFIQKFAESVDLSATATMLRITSLSETSSLCSSLRTIPHLLIRGTPEETRYSACRIYLIPHPTETAVLRVKVLEYSFGTSLRLKCLRGNYSADELLYDD